MNKTAKLDKVDYQLLRLLQRNSNVTHDYLSRQIGLSKAAVFERVKRLETVGYIKNYYALIDTEKAGLNVTFFLQVALASNSQTAIRLFLQKVDEVDAIIECHHVTGFANFLLKIVTTDMHSFQQLLLGEMSKIEEIGSIASMIVLSVVKDSKVIPLPAD